MGQQSRTRPGAAVGPSTFRARRRSAAQKHALAPLRRAIGAIDPLGRRKYLQEFTQAFQKYERAISRETLLRFCAEADTLLVSDFHALDACEFFLCELMEELTAIQQRALVLMMEAVFTRDQHILDEWQQREISDDELRQRLHFEAEWGYEWEPFLHTLKIARDLKIPIYGADCAPRGNIRRIAQRDRHAADTIGRIRKENSNALILVMFGESHLAPTHLPRELRRRLPTESIRIVLQNVDELYFRAAGELSERVAAVQVDGDTAAVFNATPVEKWHSYRLCISRWRDESRKAPDFTPLIYDLIDALLAFLHIDRYADEDSGSRYFVDCYPEVANMPSVARAGSLLSRKPLQRARRDEVMAQLVDRGSCYIPELNLIIAHQLRMQAATSDAASFVHHACRDFEEAESPRPVSDASLYISALEHALLHFGAQVLYPSETASEDELLSLYSMPKEEIEAGTLLSYREYMRVLDCVMLHRDYECHRRSYAAPPALIRELLLSSPAGSKVLATQLGRLLGGDLYRAYLAGFISRRTIRSLFFRKLHGGKAREIYFSLARSVRSTRTNLLAA
jgi:heme-binding uptake protein ChaN (Tiki superfamily)